MNFLFSKETVPSPLINVSKLSKHYVNGTSQIVVLQEINFRMDGHDLVAIMGPSGSGKSTFLHILGLLLQPTRGSYTIAGEDMLMLGRTAQAIFRRQRLGFVFQTCDLLANSLVYENLEMPLIYSKVPKRERPGKILAALEKVNLPNRIYHRANQLSGGEQQRVAVARALVNRPQIILADEPTGQLDRVSGHLILDHLEEIVRTEKAGVVLVTHNAEIAARCARTYFLRDGVLYE